MPATHPLARYAAMAISRDEPFRTYEPRRNDTSEPRSETKDVKRSSKSAAPVPRQRTKSALLSEQ
jgi:hypothetical protein